jgi:8-oxo-dGTP pyrophosphatase MutT (NUDIX family)
LTTNRLAGWLLIAEAGDLATKLEAREISQKARRAPTAPVTNARTLEFRQVAAVPLRLDERGVAQVLLVTSRETQRWVIPKGWPMKGRKPSDAAAQEAFEEAGVIGKVEKKPIGRYAYFKRRAITFDLCEVEVFILAVEKQARAWPEQGQRRAKWFAIEEAAKLVDEPGLVAVFLALAETSVGKR